MMRTMMLMGCILLAGRPVGAYQKESVLDDVREIADDLAKGKDVKKKVEALRKKEDDLTEIMRAYKPRAKGGIGYGPKASNDGIEKKILDLGRKALTKDALAKERADLGKMLHLNRAISRIVHE